MKTKTDTARRIMKDIHTSIINTIKRPRPNDHSLKCRISTGSWVKVGLKSRLIQAPTKWCCSIWVALNEGTLLGDGVINYVISDNTTRHAVPPKTIINLSDPDAKLKLMGMIQEIINRS